MNIIKICKRHGELTEKDVSKHTKNNSLQCRLCHRLFTQNYKKRKLLENPDLYKKTKAISEKKYKSKNLEKTRIHNNNWYLKNKDKVKNKNKKYIEKLTDNYIKNEIQRRVGKISIPSDLIEIKRLHIKLKRELKKGN